MYEDLLLGNTHVLLASATCVRDVGKGDILLLVSYRVL
jgi:hypothetical protein